MTSIAEVKQQLAGELRDDVVRGRGRLPRDKSGRVDETFLKATRERPQEIGARSGRGFESLAQLVAIATPAPIAAVLTRPRDRVARLEAIDRELCTLLATETPATWYAVRRPLIKILKRARGELRKLERARMAT